MRQTSVYYVPWRDQGSGLYLYGTKLSIDKHGEVVIDNPLMPAGTTIMQWDSHLNYQERRTEPLLPVLETGQEYVFRAIMKAEPDHGIMFRFDFYDRQQEQIGHLIIREYEEVFTLPEGTYSYTLQLIQTGAGHITFRHVEIYPKDCLLYTLIQKKKEEKSYHVLFLEPSGNSAIFPDSRYIDRIRNLLVVPHLVLNHENWQAEILKGLELADKEAETTKIRFLAYGPISNAAAVWASRKWRHGVVTVKPEFLSVYEGRKQEMFPALVERCTKLRNWTGNERKAK